MSDRNRGRPLPFEAFLYVCLAGAAIRLQITDLYAPIPWISSPYIDVIWTGLALLCPTVAGVSWWLIHRSDWVRSTLAGIWLRTFADIGLLTVVMVYHLSVVLHPGPQVSEARIPSRYIVGAAILYLIVLVICDAREIRRVNRRASEMCP